MQEPHPFFFGKIDELGRTPLHYMVDRIVRSFDMVDQPREAGRRLFQKLVEVHPASLSMVDADGDTPLVVLLMTSLFGDDPMGRVCEEDLCNIVKIMVELHPECVDIVRRLPRPWHYHSKRHSSQQQEFVHGEGVPSPLSCAILSGRSPETIQLLLSTCRRVSSNPCSAVVSHQQELPLHIAATMDSSMELLEILIENEPRALDVPDESGLVPMDWMWIRHVIHWSSPTHYAPVGISRRRYISVNFLEWHERVSNQYLGIDESIETSSSNPVIQSSLSRLRQELNEKINKMLPIMARLKLTSREEDVMETDTDTKPSPFPLLHAACVVNCPLAIVMLTCSAYPDHLKTRCLETGRLPLHFAASRSGYNRQFSIGVTVNMQRMEEVSPVQVILSKLPLATRITDHKNQLPLHIAIDQMKSHRCEWEHSLKTVEEQRKIRNWTRQVDALLEEYPDALHRRDGITKLLPFQQASAGLHGDVELTYALLRRDPTLLIATLSTMCPMEL